MKAAKHILMFFLFCVTLMACGKKEKKQNQSPSQTETKAASSETITTINLTASDAMQFNKNKIEVNAGEKVRLTLTHTGKMPKTVMGHNFVLLKKGVDLTDFGTEAATATDSEFIPNDGDDVIVHTKLIGGGESTTIEFNAPESGIYDFLCSFPGHFAIMKGKFIVK
ncbi:azurin [Pseudotamlana carrageenivorans]|uniref:Azurin n=1 Tax=Pseudotamlana carrageenivorans TaxID=2069432 RepID=A0A2I7SIH5_9FLAO|nr:azurin [Tamlana carrageenivorans]AUS05690.1 azurin [Tamlana carrageenivorans]